MFKHCSRLQFINIEVMLTIILIFSLVIGGLADCSADCQTCRLKFSTDYMCLGCKQGFQLITQFSICLQDASIKNCALYNPTLDCLLCQPTYRQSINLCTKVFDGCLQYNQTGCSLCLQGSFINPDTNSCAISHLNCRTISDRGQCMQCFSGYAIKNGKCVGNGECLGLNMDTGMCAECGRQSLLVGYVCVPKDSNVSKNCYMAERGTNITCLYCKMGYGAYFGQCFSVKSIILVFTSNNSQCSNLQFFRDNQIFCLTTTGLVLDKCLMADFGFRRCLICQAKYMLNSNFQCLPILNNFCKQLSSNGTICLQCKETFYLKQGNCLPYPPFCLNYSSTCTQCAQSFRLVQGRCVDPNCQTVNLVTGYCHLCFINYQISPGGVCKYVDANCKTTNNLGQCTQCLNGYYLKNNGLCGFKDNNCITFDSTGLCTLCKPFFYFNMQGQICIPLPSNCVKADLAGRCIECTDPYILTSAYQCLFITALPQCKMVNYVNFTLCAICTNGFFVDQKGKCQQLPPFCNQVDRVTFACIQCTPNGLMKGSNCVDKNCQIFDSQGICLACLRSFQFGQFGECIPETRDANCKEYQYGICKSCSQRYFFDFQFNCIPVSPFCQNYDSNSGECTSCYGGYQLINNGACTVVPFNSMTMSIDLLGDACKTHNLDGQCIACSSNYHEVPNDSGSNGTQVVNCIQKILGNNYCLKYDQSYNKCLKCVSRMYVDRQGACKSIDQSCQKYNSTTGYCISCYSGFMLSSDRRSCYIQSNIDTNCQQRDNQTKCIKCYQGYYLAVQTLMCSPVDPMCATHNLTNGGCLSCYGGYQLQANQCVLSVTLTEQPNTNNQNGSISNSNNTPTPIRPTGCKTYNSSTEKCQDCEWGFVMQNQTCIQRDQQCQSFQNNNSLICTNCYIGYSVFPKDKSKCVLSDLLLQNCVQYNSNIECLQCKSGHVLTQNVVGIKPAFICTPIDPNCLQHNSTTNMCQVCSQGTVLEGRVCIHPMYGIDDNCVLYVSRICEKCKDGSVKTGHICSKQQK